MAIQKFKRVEKKYIITLKQKDELLEILKSYMEIDAFCKNGFDMDRIMRRDSISKKAHIDLWEANRMQLMDCGLFSKNIEVAGICTYTDYTNFFSARRLGIKSGRILSGITLI